MSSLCPRCLSDSLRDVSLTSVGLQICTVCQTALFPEKSRLALGRKLMPHALELWKEQLLASSLSPFPAEPPECPEHGQLMVRGRVLDFASECWRAECCDLLLLEPTEMVPFLDELKKGSSLPRAKSKSPGGWPPLMFLVRKLVKEEGDEAIDRELAEAQFNNKLAPVLIRSQEENKGECCE